MITEKKYKAHRKWAHLLRPVKPSNGSAEAQARAIVDNIVNRQKYGNLVNNEIATRVVINESGRFEYEYTYNEKMARENDIVKKCEEMRKRLYIKYECSPEGILLKSARKLRDIL